MTKKYHVFISSVPDDIKNERRDLIKSLIEMGVFPVTMDSFDRNDKNSQKLIRKAIDESDYFINLTAHKIGADVGTSYALEAELSWAENSGVPVLALIIGDKARWKENKKEQDAKALKALDALKKRLMLHIYDTWNTASEICGKAQKLLAREMNLNPRCGWVPAIEAVDPAVANELARLLRENEHLKNQYRLEGSVLIGRIREQIKKTLRLLTVNKVSLSFRYESGEDWENTTLFRYVKIFRLLVPELSLPKTTADLSRFLGNVLNPELEKTVRKEYPTPTNTIKKIMADLNLLKLVKCSGTGDDEAWEVTEYGKETYAAYRIRQLERALKNQVPMPDKT
ncbi:MAG: DUF4062 domain-containing protein [Treponema sp.]|jgi:hypothetical protein|nr:DUF4062 domain-containing protein [Treponema sp.]